MTITFSWWSIGDSTACFAALASFFLGSRFGRMRTARYSNIHRIFSLTLAPSRVRIPIFIIRKRNSPKTVLFLVEHRGFEPLTPTLPVWCAPSCANAPYLFNSDILSHFFTVCNKKEDKRGKLLYNVMV